MLSTLKNYLFNITDKSEISITKLLFDFYLLVGANFVGNLYSKQLIDAISDSRYVQHLIGIILMLSLVVSSSKLKKQSSIFVYTVIAYILFTFSTKVDLRWNIAIMGLLFVSYFYEQKMSVKEKDSESDQALEDEDIQKITKKNNFNRNVLLGSIAIVIVIGASLYFSKKKIQYGGDFDMVKFVCNGCSKK